MQGICTKIKITSDMAVLHFASLFVCFFFFFFLICFILLLNSSVKNHSLPTFHNVAGC